MQHEELPSQLVREGDMMLKSLLSDLQEAGIRNLVCTRDPRLNVTGDIKVLQIDSGVWDIWRKCMKESEAVWIIAPETDGVLYELTCMAHSAGCLVIGCTPAAVQLATSKNKTLTHLDSHNVPCIPVIDEFDVDKVNLTGWVVKPDDGIGAEGCYYFPDARQVVVCIQAQSKRMIVQKYIPGISASMSVLCHGGRARLLASNRQIFRFTHGKGHLEGVVVNGLPEYFIQFESLATDITDSLPGLQGYVGVDVIISDNGPLVVEINPRLTTAYAGLRQSLGINPAEWILSMFRTGKMPETSLPEPVPVTVSI